MRKGVRESRENPERIKRENVFWNIYKEFRINI